MKETKPSFKLVNSYPIEAISQSAVPNKLIRNNLFGVIKKGDAKYVEKKVLYSQPGSEITYTGKELNQIDLSVWLIIKKAFIGKPHNKVITFSTKEVLKQLGKTHGQTDRRWLESKLLGLATGLLSFKCGMVGRLIKDLDFYDNLNTFEVEMDIKINVLFGMNMYTYLDINKRKLLKSDLAKWLYNYWSTHVDIFPIRDITIKNLSGSMSNDMSVFRKQIKKALNELVEIKYLNSYTCSRDGLITPIRNIFKKTKSINQ